MARPNNIAREVPLHQTLAPESLIPSAMADVPTVVFDVHGGLELLDETLPVQCRTCSGTAALPSSGPLVLQLTDVLFKVAHQGAT